MNLTDWPEYAEKKILSPETIEEKADALKKKGTLATVNGSYDLLHAGHLHILYEAKKQADVLIVALNSDLSVKRYKDVRRPIVPLKYRMCMMSALYFVDFVTWFEETDPVALLEKIRPDVHVNGAEYGTDCLEAATVKKYGGKIHIVTLIPGLSTTNIIEKIKKTCV